MRQTGLTGVEKQQPLDGTAHDPDALMAELPARIAAAFPASGGRGAPSRPLPLTIYRGVLERRAGCPTAHAFGALPGGRAVAGSNPVSPIRGNAGGEGRYGVAELGTSSRRLHMWIDVGA